MEENLKIITPDEWDQIAMSRIRSTQKLGSKLQVDERFGYVANWLKEFRVINTTKPQKQLFICKPYWLSDNIE